MYVYVLNRHGEPLMPCSPRKARTMLRDHKATVVRRTPFTIRLLHGCSGYTQRITLGIDAGSRKIGLSACTKKHELFVAEVKPRNDVVALLSARRELRRTRRNRKTRFRAPRFDNRIRNKRGGWVAPSVEVKIQEHITAIKRTCAILPISKVIVETAEFDGGFLRNMKKNPPLPTSPDFYIKSRYHEYNVRQHILHLDNYTCRCCSAHPTPNAPVKLRVLSAESVFVGEGFTDSHITLCEKCHELLLTEPKFLCTKGVEPRRPKAPFKGVMRKTLMKRLRAELSLPITETYGYITKLHRESFSFPKAPTTDARCITCTLNAQPSDTLYRIRALRRHNRQLHRANHSKGNVRKNNQSPYELFGFRLWDKVLFRGQECFISGRRAKGSFALKSLDGEKVSDGITYRSLVLVEKATNYLIERVPVNQP